MTRWLDDREQRVWRDFLDVHTRLQASVGQQLQSASGLSSADFQVLVELSEATQGRLRAFELGRALRWEKSRLSHHLSRMEKRALVAREGCGTDRRGAFVVLAPDGRTALEAAAPGHVEHVRALVFDALDASQVGALGEVCARLLASLEADGDGCPADPCDEDA